MAALFSAYAWITAVGLSRAAHRGPIPAWAPWATTVLDTGLILLFRIAGLLGRANGGLAGLG